VSTTPAKKDKNFEIKFSAFWLFLTGINDKKFIAGVNDTGDKFFAGVVYTGEHLFAGVVYTGDKH
jgi:hypothetical protein